MRYSEIATVPTSSMEAYNSILDIITVYMSKNKSSIPMAAIMGVLHNQGYDVTPKMIMDYLETNPNIKNVSKDMVELSTDSSELGMIPDNEKEDSEDHIKDMADSEIDADDKTRNKQHVEKLAKKAIGKT